MEEIIVEICIELNIQLTQDLGFYLDMLTINGKVIRATQQRIIDKFGKKLMGWKARRLSLTGRLTLTKYVLSALANYFMQIVNIPRKVCEDLH